MKNKKIFKLSILIVFFILVSCLSCYGITPLYKQVKMYNQAQSALSKTGAIFNTCRIKSFNMLKTDIEKLDELKRELSQTESFLGLYKYPDTNIISSINFGNNYSEYIENSSIVNGNVGFLPYEYNEGLDNINLLEIQDGEMFEFKTYKTTETLPIVVTENDYFKVGDKVKLNLNVCNDNITKFPNNDAISIDAVVCGIVNKNVYLPALYQQKFSSSTYFSKINELVWIFTPSLNEYTNLFEYQPQLDNSESIRYYALYEKESPNAEEIINKYGFYDVVESMNTIGWDLQREYFYFEETNITTVLFVYLLTYITTAVFFIKEIIRLLYRIRKDIYD